MANDFSGNPNLVALYTYETSIHTDESGKGNTLAGGYCANVPSLAGAGYEGDDSGLYDGGDECHGRDDADLTSNFPLKSGATNRSFTIGCWIYPLAASDERCIWSKYNADGDLRSLALRVRADDTLVLTVGYNGGVSFYYHNNLDGASEITLDEGGAFQHIILAFDGTTLTGLYYHPTSGEIEISETLTQTINISVAPFVIGALADSAYVWNGAIDELVIIDEVMSLSDMRAIRQGTYGAAAAGIEIFRRRIEGY